MEKICLYTPKKYINCQDPYFINVNFCSKRLEILEKIRKVKKEKFLKLQESRKKIEVIIPLKSTHTEASSHSKSNSETEDFLKSILNNDIDSKIDMKTVSKL